MGTRIAAAPARTLTAEEAAALVAPATGSTTAIALCQPDVFDEALAARAAELQERQDPLLHLAAPRAVLEADPEGEHFFWFSWHFSGYDRRKHDAGICNYIPVNLGEIPDYYRRFIRAGRHRRPQDLPDGRDGYFNFGAANLWHGAIVERASDGHRRDEPRLPYVYGVENGVHVERGRLHHRGRRRSRLPNCRTRRRATSTARSAA